MAKKKITEHLKIDSTLAKMTPDIKQPDDITRKYLVSAIVIAVAVWDLSFNFGAHKVIFFEKFFLIWVISLAILIADFALKDNKILKGKNLIAMLTPTAVLGLTVWSYSLDQTNSLFNYFIFGFTTLLTILFLPFAVYIILSVTQSDVLKVKSKRLTKGLVALTIIIGTLGFTIGHYNNYFLSCESFEVSGNDTPDNCHQQERKLIDRF